jgi:hypothetical protein
MKKKKRRRLGDYEIGRFKGVDHAADNLSIA